MTKAEKARADALEIEVLAQQLCMKAGENPAEERWRAYIEPARATIAAKRAAKE